MSVLDNEVDRHILKKYELGTRLGKGAYGIVWKAEDKKTRELVALKKIFDAYAALCRATRLLVLHRQRWPRCCIYRCHKRTLCCHTERLPCGTQPSCLTVLGASHLSTSLPVSRCARSFQNSTDAQRTYREVIFLQEMRGHDHIISLHNVMRAENDKDLYLVFEYMETDLNAAIKAKILQDIHKQYIIYQCFSALQYARVPPHTVPPSWHTHELPRARLYEARITFVYGAWRHTADSEPNLSLLTVCCAVSYTATCTHVGSCTAT